MARILGEDGVVEVGGTAVAHVNNWSYNEEGAKVPVPAMGDSAIVELAGKPRVNGTVRCWYDDAADAGQAALAQGAQVALNLFPKANTTGNPRFVIAAAEIDSVSWDFPVEGGATVEFNYSATALATKDTVP